MISAAVQGPVEQFFFGYLPIGLTLVAVALAIRALMTRIDRNTSKNAEEIFDRLVPAPVAESSPSTERAAGLVQHGGGLGAASEIEIHLSPQDQFDGDAERRRTYRLLAEYSAQGLAQSRTSFRVAIVFGALGFVVIVIGVVFALLGGSARASGALIPVIAGAVTDAVGALFFTINMRAQRVMVGFFDKLRADRRLEESLALIPQIDDSTIASRLQVLLALQLVGASDMPDLLRQIIDPSGPSTPRSGAQSSQVADSSAP